MVDYNIVIKNRSVIENLGWCLEHHGSEDWCLSIYLPHCKLIDLWLSNTSFLEDLQSEIDNFNINDLVNTAVEEVLALDCIPNYKNIISDFEWYRDKLVELYNTLKSTNGFTEADTESDSNDSDDTGSESQETDK